MNSYILCTYALILTQRGHTCIHVHVQITLCYDLYTFTILFNGLQRTLRTYLCLHAQYVEHDCIHAFNHSKQTFNQHVRLHLPLKARGNLIKIESIVSVFADF